MTVVTAEHENPFDALPEFREWTVDDLDRLPDDGRRYELFDGSVVMSPSPFPRHQRVVLAIYRLLHASCPSNNEVFVAPFDFRPNRQRAFRPDVLVVRRSDVEDDKHLVKPPVLVVEVLSDSTRSVDRVFKLEMYLTSGVDFYWIFDPQGCEFVAHERDGDKYVQVAVAADDERITLDRPFPVEICPAEIVKG